MEDLGVTCLVLMRLPEAMPRAAERRARKSFMVDYCFVWVVDDLPNTLVPILSAVWWILWLAGSFVADYSHEINMVHQNTSMEMKKAPTFISGV